MCARGTTSSFYRKIDTIRQEDIEEWLESHSRLSPRSLKNFRDSVKTFLNWAKEQKYISDNPATKVKVPVIDWKPPVILTVEESKKLFQTAEENENHRSLIPFLVLASFAGLRTAEISRLDWTAVNIKRKQVTIGVDQAKKFRSG